MNNDIINRLSKFSYIMSLVWLCTLGVCPAFAIMGLTVGIVFKNKKVKLSDENSKKIQASAVMGIIALVLFVIDIILLLHFAK